MRNSVEYQIYIGCKDVSLHGEVVTRETLTQMVVRFFTDRQIDFSLVPAKGGFLHDDGHSDWCEVVPHYCSDLRFPSN